MPVGAREEIGLSNEEMIARVLKADPGLPTPEVRAVVWERYEGEVTAAEIARVRKRLRPGDAKRSTGRKPRRRKKEGQRMPRRKESAREAVDEVKPPEPEVAVAEEEPNAKAPAKGPSRKRTTTGGI